MGKLFFLDDLGNQHQISLQNIQTKDFDPGDVLVAYYEVGDASLEDSKIALEQLKILLQSIFPEGIKIITIASRNGARDVDIKAFKHSENTEVKIDGQG